METRVAEIDPRSKADRENHRRIARRFKVLSDPNRIAILDGMSRIGPMNVRRTCQYLGNAATQPAVSHHLFILLSEKLIDVERVGRENLYSITEEGFRAVTAIGEQK